MLCIDHVAGLSFACDLTIAAGNTKFVTTAINVGLVCLGPAALPLARLVGRKRPYEKVQTGDMITAEETQRPRSSRLLKNSLLMRAMDGPPNRVG